MVISNLINENNDKKIANQFIFTIEKYNIEVFQSYDTIIAVRDLRTNLVYTDNGLFDYSKTTAKHFTNYNNSVNGTVVLGGQIYKYAEQIKGL